MTAVLSRRLPATFEHVTVSAEESPDLTQPPFFLSAPGGFITFARSYTLFTIITEH